jgi:hypothetical protein
MVHFIELNGDQSRETVNTRQRFQAWSNAVTREHGYRGSMVWERSKGHEYLFRVYYDQAGKRRHKALGRRSEDTEATKAAFDAERAAAHESRQKLDETMARQAAVNRALGLGRVPVLAARILRLLSEKRLLGHGLRVVGTNALFAYEAAAGVHLASDIMTTGDLDLLVDTRTGISFIGEAAMDPEGLIGLMRKADRSFRRSNQQFRAENDDGYMVDLITPMRNPPWAVPAVPRGEPDLSAAEIEGLTWLENAPTLEQICVDERGQPLVMKTVDPRVFAIHKHWVAERPERDPLKRRRDALQAKAAFDLTRTYLVHLSFQPADLRMLPKKVMSKALSDLGKS